MLGDRTIGGVEKDGKGIENASNSRWIGDGAVTWMANAS
jgi:hypothetical protein